jgi:predicted nucleotidyltransferase
MLNANGETYETLRPYAETIDLDGIPVKTINLEGLLLTKKTSRDKDVADRIIIERAIEAFRSNTADDD